MTLSLLKIKKFKEFIYDIYPKELTIFERHSLLMLLLMSTCFLLTTKLYYKHNTFGFHTVNFPYILSQAIVHLHQVMVSMHFNSFPMHVVVQIIVTFVTPRGPCDKTFVPHQRSSFRKKTDNNNKLRATSGTTNIHQQRSILDQHIDQRISIIIPDDQIKIRSSIHLR